MPNAKAMNVVPKLEQPLETFPVTYAYMIHRVFTSTLDVGMDIRTTRLSAEGALTWRSSFRRSTRSRRPRYRDCGVVVATFARCRSKYTKSPIVSVFGGSAWKVFIDLCHSPPLTLYFSASVSLTRSSTSSPDAYPPPLRC